MFRWIKAWWAERIVRRSPINDAEWQDVFQDLRLFRYLTMQERAKLKRLAILLLHYKVLESVGELEITNRMRAEIALQACLPILNLGLDWYEGWISIILYPGEFSRQSTEVDECGVVHQGRVHLSGESWQRGPVILSWDNSRHRENSSGNVIIHEFAHKLDMLNGRANGFPPLHKEMSAHQWAEVFNRAYADFERHLQEGTPLPINSYAAASPGEFFAVFSEYFFEEPGLIKQYYPEVYELLISFYRQDPLNGRSE
ncbi:Mlc titration factor A [Legionella massiliensis]|uniref:Mlc titration factor A n=1 Tax=Legionella massiliensis TaxID=1034943 RepID=A0A078KXS5_9GAMM|nr:M90 family metallopeptidase [Legionella massiliensis]CDZ77771.1 Mlc titration factor A [Legionella massiliensis]CEE13509.1 Protein MtfA [Legionella massiliensis]